MARGVRRRSFVQGVFYASAAAWAGLSTACGGGDGDGGAASATTVRRSAASMTSAEIDRFQRAYAYAVARGFFDSFNDTHYDHHHQRHHGADVLATSPMTVEIMPTSWGHRLLPWHRSFLIEAEQMLRAALRARNEEEGKDPSEADLLFIPYWAAAGEQGLPRWILDFEPEGGTALVPPGLPEGHAGYGKKVGERYDIVFGRWPGKNTVFDTLPTPDHIGRILAKETFAELYDALDVTPEIVVASYARARAALDVLAQKLPGNQAVATLNEAFSMPPSQASGGAEATNALLEIGYEAAAEERRPTPDASLIGAVKDVYSLFIFPPHIRMHLWAGGLAPQSADIRGTVTYFQELTVDPVFWMLHAEIDRIWYTWEKSHAEKPPLSGDDAIFNPITAEEGGWYGGGKTFALDELTEHDGLPYTYDTLFPT